MALYDYGLTLYQVQRIPEAFNLLSQAKMAFGAQNRLYRGLATWGMATCLFDRFHYRGSRAYFHEALKDLNDKPYASEVAFGLTLTRWITNPSTTNLQHLMDFNASGGLDNHLQSRWFLAMAITHRREGLFHDAMDFAKQIQPTTAPPEVYLESLAERALSALELGDIFEMSHCIRQVRQASFKLPDTINLFVELLNHMQATNCLLSEVTWKFAEGYDQRINRLVEIIQTRTPK